MNKNKAVFLDRDGVINEDFGYVYKVDKFKFCDGIFEALNGFSELGYKLIVVTNQSGIGRGYYSLEQFDTLCEFMLDEFIKNGVRIDKICFCPHSPEEKCECRKPSPKMIQDVAKELNINLSNSIMIGDKDSDIMAGKAAGVGQNFLIDGVNLKSVKELFLKIKENL